MSNDAHDDGWLLTTISWLLGIFVLGLLLRWREFLEVVELIPFPFW